MMLLEALKKYVVVPNKKEADKRLLSKWIEEYDQRINCRGLVGDCATGWYWVDDQDNALHCKGDYGWRAEITMRQLAQLCDIDYDKWMFDKPLMSLVAVLKQYAVKQTEREAKMCLLYKWIGEYAFDPTFAYWISGDTHKVPYWIDGDDRLRCEKCSFRKVLSMREFAELCGIDYDSWMPPKKPVENTGRLEKAIREYEESKKKSTPDPLANLLTQIHISFDGMTTHCVVKDRTGVVARSKAVCVGEDQESYDQLVGTIVSIYNLIPREQQMELMDRVMEVMQVGVDIEINPEAKLVDMRNE